MIEFSSEQTENMRVWKESLKSEKARKWAKSEEEAEERIRVLLARNEFEQGADLTADTLDELFRELRSFSANRNLSNLLYRNPGLEPFNRKLRDLYYGTGPFARRVDEFFQMKSIGIQTLSQFLVALDSTKYPLVTTQTKEMLNLDSFQEEAARKAALQRYEIHDPDLYLERTIDFLADMITFESVKSITGVEKYTHVNNLLWFGKISQDETAEDESPFTSVSLEGDLRDYLAANPGVIERGLTLQKKEFDTEKIGRIDLLCKDKNGIPVVIELKKGRKSDEVVGQTLRYIGWVKQNSKTRVRGIIIVNEPDIRLEYALAPLENMIEVKYYRVKFEISKDYYSP